MLLARHRCACRLGIPARLLQLNPGRLIHRVEAAKVYYKLGQVQKAEQLFESSLSMDIDDINAHLTRLGALALLAEIRSKKAQASGPAPPVQLA